MQKHARHTFNQLGLVVLILVALSACRSERVPKGAILGKWSLNDGLNLIEFRETGECSVDEEVGVWKYDGGVIHVDFVDLPPAVTSRGSRKLKGDAAQVVSLEGNILTWRLARTGAVQVLQRRE